MKKASFDEEEEERDARPLRPKSPSELTKFLGVNISAHFSGCGSMCFTVIIELQ